MFFYYCLFLLLHAVLSLLFINLHAGLFDFNNIIYIPIQLFFFAQIVSELLITEKKKSIVKKISLSFLFLAVILIIVFKPEKIEAALQGSEQLILITYCIIFYFERLEHTDNLFIYTTPGFWAINSIFIYACGTFFAYLFRGYLSISDEFVQQYRYLHYTTSIIANLLTSVCFLLPEKTITANKTHYFE